MSHFSSALQRIVESRAERRGAQTLLARQAGVEPASFSRYINDESRPDVAILEKICLALDETERAEVVIGYLRDDVPPSARNLIRIIGLISSEKLQEEPPEERPRLPKKVREAFDHLEQLAQHEEVVADAILSTYALLRGRRP